MSKTNAPPDFLPVFPSPDSNLAKTPERSSASEGHSHPDAGERTEFSLSEIAGLRAFFELLDKWDLKETGE
jgi:hypothetical protein